MDNPEPRAQYLNVVLRQIERSALRIPRFQRHFVWNEKDVLELLGSIQRGYPIGSILTWKVDSREGYFSGYREDPFPPADETVQSFEVILDGAQRLSSLYGCLRSPRSNPIYEVFYDARATEFVHRTSLKELGDWHVPMHSLFDSRAFLSVQERIARLEDGETLLPRALDLYATFQDYQVPIIALSNAVLEDVVEVFRRVNSSGTPLSSVDFVRALTWQSSFDLEETFESFAERYAGTPIDEFTEEFLIRCLAMTAGLSMDARDVIQLKRFSTKPAGLSREVEMLQEGLDKLADFLGSVGIESMREVPYEVQRLLLFSFMLYDAQADRDEIESWFWLTTFAEEHQSKPESYVSRLVRELRAGNPGPAFEVRKPIDPSLFANRVRRSGTAVALGFDLLLRRLEARSLLSGERIDPAEARHAQLFSRAQLRRANPAFGQSGSILANLVLLSPDDALQWRKAGGDPTELYRACEEATGDAAAIWFSQGLVGSLDVDAEEVMERRSAELLGRVIPMERLA